MTRPTAQRPPWAAPLAATAAITAMAATVGAASAFFLWSLDAVTSLRFAHPWLLWLLPAAGFAIATIYQKIGRTANGGNHLLLEEIHQPTSGVPRRMAPLILLGTLASHLFGASVGREGTALQIGGGIAAAFARHFHTKPETVRTILMSGVAAGFGGVFGAPIAGAVFAIEVLGKCHRKLTALIPCLLASSLAHLTCLTCGAKHLHYTVSATLHWDLKLLGIIALIAFAASAVADVFVLASHTLTRQLTRLLPHPGWRAFAGGSLVVALVLLMGNRDYLGLGILAEYPSATTLPAFFHGPTASPIAWLWKALFTLAVITTGFKGGEVTPLLFIGAALGNAIASTFGAPFDLTAALGMVAIFAAATRTPIASTLLGIEFFGLALTLPLAIACLTACSLSRSAGLYALPSNPSPTAS